MKVGDKVKISPTVTSCPWKGEPIGKVVSIDKDGTVAVEIESDDRLGHYCIIGSNAARTKNGWWFMPEELEVINAT